MKSDICPYLGLVDDPSTAVEYPSEGNFCHHAQPIQPVRGTYQNDICLTPDHAICPLYLAAQPRPMPAAIAAPIYSRSQGRKFIALIGVPILIATAAALVSTWDTFGSQLLGTQGIPQTGVQAVANNNQFDPLGLGAKRSPTATQPAKVAAANSHPLESCAVPGDWVTYTVNPGDSISRLSVIYGVAVEDIQRVNCMGSNPVILPGQVIYVPFAPTSAQALLGSAKLAQASATSTVQETTATARITPAPTYTEIPFQPPVFGPPPVIYPRPPQVTPPTATQAPKSTSTDTAVPPTNTAQPLPSSTARPTNTSAPSITPVPPTATNAPTNTSVPPTQAPRPTNTRRPTRTPDIPTNTPVPPIPTDTPVVPTATPDTPIPPTDVPPTATDVPPTATDVPPTATSQAISPTDTIAPVPTAPVITVGITPVFIATTPAPTAPAPTDTPTAAL